MADSTDIPENAPAHCPGTESLDAGKTSSCAGCPNQQICASGKTNNPDPAVNQIRIRLLPVQHKILVLSGKGGVGKSTFANCLARALAYDQLTRGPNDLQVGLLDIDICGPSMPTMLGLAGEQVQNNCYAVDSIIEFTQEGTVAQGPTAGGGAYDWLLKVRYT